MKTGRLAKIVEVRTVTVCVAVLTFLAMTSVQCSRKPEPRPVAPAADVNKSIAERGLSTVALLDTNEPSAAAYGAYALALKAGWTLLPEDVTKHEFKGDAVIVNDRLVAVIRARGAGIETYSVTTKGLVHRATLTLAAQADEEACFLASASVVENTAAAAEMSVIFGTSGGHKMMSNVRLVSASSVVELSPGDDTASVGVAATARGIIVPDYFSDDVTYLAERGASGKVLLPVENFFLALLGDGAADTAMMMCVNEAAGAEPEVQFGAGRTISGWRIPCVRGKGNRIWFAFLEAPSLWSVEKVNATAPDTRAVLNWKPPFPARWRADVVGTNGDAASFNVLDREQPGACCWRSDTSGVSGGGPVTLRPAAAVQDASAILYPIDRTSRTPIDVKLPVDIMRETLGVGPCAYILALEGGADSESPTPADVMTFVEKQFERKQAAAAKADIEKRLAKMVEHDRHVRERMRAYATTIRELTEQAPETVFGSPPSGLDTQLVDYCRRHAAAMKTPERVAELAAKIIALIPNPDGAAACKEIGDELRSIGEAEDAVLSKCRMTARRIRALCRAADVPGPDRAFAQSALPKIDALLQGK